MSQIQTLQVPVRGMDCNECVQHVQHALTSLPGVESATVYLAAEKASIRYDPNKVNLATMRKAVKAAGYTIPDEAPQVDSAPQVSNFRQRVAVLLAVVFGIV